MLSVSSNALQVAGLLQAGEAALPEASARVNQAVGTMVLLETTQALEEAIYNQPLPESYARYGLEDRTGALLAGEALLQKGPHESVITTVNSGVAGKDPTQYAALRHDNARYPAPWRTLGLEEAEPKIVPVAEAALAEAMPDGLVVPGGLVVP